MKRPLLIVASVLLVASLAAWAGLPQQIIPAVYQGLTWVTPLLTLSSAGSGNAVLALSGNTSGAATFTAPAIAGTVTNPVVSTNAISAPQFNGGTRTGIYNFNSALQSQLVVSGTEYYITSSDLDMPAVYSTAIAAGTTMRWHVQMQKTAAGTGAFQINLKKGTAASIADSNLVTQVIGITQTAAVDNLTLDVTLTFTSATAAYWSLSPRQLAATGTGFDLVYPAVALDFNGTVSGQTTTTASDKYGLSFTSTTGVPTVTVTQVQAQAFGVN